MIISIQLKSTGEPVVEPAMDLYNRIMQDIEPELCTQNAETALQAVANDTLEERKARARRYEVAFARYRHTLDDYNARWQRALRMYKKSMLINLEHSIAERDLYTVSLR